VILPWQFRVKNPGPGKYNFKPRVNIEKSINRIASRLHYLGSHSPAPISKKWKTAEKKFFNRYRKHV
jgi:hypothetical protein